jgi:ribokinase
MSVAILQANGEYGAVFVSGSNTKIDPTQLENDWRALGGAKVLVLQNEVPEAVNLAAAQVAKARGTRIVLNAAPARPLDEELRALVDMLVVNRVEAEALTGVAVADRATAKKALPKLVRENGAVVITLGGQGLVVQEGFSAAVEIEALPVKVTSAHGAGDCFVGVVAAELAVGAGLAGACMVANRKAAEFVARPRHI